MHLGKNADGIPMNQYFIDHPEMIVGRMEMVSGPYGMEPTCSPVDDVPFEEQLRRAAGQVRGEIEASGLYELEDEIEK